MGDATNWALGVEAGDGRSKALLLVLAHYADQTEDPAKAEVILSRKSLAAMTEMSPRTVSDAGQRLERRGLVRIRSRRNTDGGLAFNGYTLAVDR